MKKRYFVQLWQVLIVMGILLISVGFVEAKQCTLNEGAYIAHSKANIEKAQNHVWNGRWAELNKMAQRGELRKIERT